MSNTRHVTALVRALLQATVLTITFTVFAVGCGGELSGGVQGDVARKARQVQVVGSVGADGRTEYLVVPMLSGARLTVERARAIGQRAASVDELTALLDRLPDGSSVFVASAAQFVGRAGQLRTLPHAIAEQLAVVRPGVSIIDSRAPSADGVGIQSQGLSSGGGWGRGLTSRGNCYRYAADDKMSGTLATNPAEHFESPGDLRGSGPGGCPTCADMMKGAKADGMSAPGKDGKCAEGFYQVCALVATDPKKCDFHWARDNGDGTWSHKPGALAISDRDASDNKITDPKTADWDYGNINYDTFCGCLCVPNGGIDVDAHDNDNLATTTGVVIGVEGY